MLIRRRRADDVLRASAHLMENVTDPKTSFSKEPNTAPLQRAFNTDAPFFEILKKPENAFRFRRFGLAMMGGSAAQLPAAILQGSPQLGTLWYNIALTLIKGFDWDTVPKGGVIVDVGGGIGNVSLEIA